jgi:hypothetical protein
LGWLYIIALLSTSVARGIRDALKIVSLESVGGTVRGTEKYGTPT